MIGLVVKAVIVFSMMFGSAGGAVVASADSMPDSPLYPVKLAVEQARLALTFDDAGKAEMHLKFARERVREMTQEEALPDQAAVERLQKELRKGLAHAIELPDEDLMAWLTLALEVTEPAGRLLRPRDRLRTDPPNESARPDNEQLMKQLMLKLRKQNGTVEDVLLLLTLTEDPDQKGTQNQNGPGPNGSCDETECDPVGDEHKYGGPCEGADCDPGQYGQPCEGEECIPAGDEHKYGGPCEGDDCDPGQYGPGEPCDDEQCVPAGDENKYQYAGPCEGDDCERGKHGESEPCDGEDCLPEGDQNQYGPSPGGSCEGVDCEPSGDQNQYGEPGQYGPGPDEPCDGEDCDHGQYGPGAPCEGADCEPAGNQYGEPGPSGPCEGEECEPAGDQNQYGAPADDPAPPSEPAPPSDPPPDPGDSGSDQGGDAPDPGDGGSDQGGDAGGKRP